MSKVYTDPVNYSNIADAIREKNGTQATYRPAQMAAAIRAIETEPVIEPLIVNENGTYTAPSGVDGYSPITVNVSGGGGAARLFLGLVEASVLPIDTCITIHSDTEIKSTISMANLSVSSNVTAVEYVDSLTFKLTVTGIAVGDTITVLVYPSGYVHANGSSETLTLTVAEYTPDSLLNTTKHMTIVRNNNKVDSGTDSCTMTKSWPGVLSYPRNVCTTFILNADEYVTISNLGQSANAININNRDGAMSYTWKQEGTMVQNINFLKFRWKGSAHYSTNPDTEWEIIFLSNGDAYLNLIRQGATWTGSFSFLGKSYTLNTANPLVAFYRKNYLGTEFEIVNEMYSLSHHKTIADALFHEYAFADVYLDYDNEECKYRNNSKNDDGTDLLYLGFTWRYNSSDYTTVYASGNSFIGFGSASSENVKMNRRDAASYYIFARYAVLTDQSNLKGIQIVWGGASAYNGSIDQWWQLWLFENGDAMIQVKRVGSNSGTSSFCGHSFTPANDGVYSFYRNDAEGTTWTMENAVYDVTHHRI